MLQQCFIKIQIVLNFPEYHQITRAHFKILCHENIHGCKVNIGLSVNGEKLELTHATSLCKKWGSFGPLLFLNVTV